MMTSGVLICLLAKMSFLRKFRFFDGTIETSARKRLQNEINCSIILSESDDNWHKYCFCRSKEKTEEECVVSMYFISPMKTSRYHYL